MREEICWNRKWAFTKNVDEVPSSMPQRWDYVNIPHTWNDIDGQDGGDDFYRGNGYYAKELKLSDLPEADEYYMQFDGTNSSASLYVNGINAGSHDGGYSTWRVNITKLLQEDNLIVVVVNNAPNDHVYPQSADFTFYGGMYRDVKILAVNRTHFDLDCFGGNGIAVTPIITDKDAAPSGTVQIRVRTWIKDPAGTLRIVIRDRDDSIVSCREIPAAEANDELLEIPDVHIWNGIRDPYLYTAEACIIPDENTDEHTGNITDCVRTRFGVRSYRIDPDKGFILNGKEYPLRGVARHQDRWAKGNALSEDDHREDMDIIREMGANTIRLAHYQHSQFFYDLCDQYGMVVWAEIPYISMHLAKGRDNTISKMKELIIQNYNHPSI
ncbi:MAG: glycoside hydrolase family 2 protein, partial [Lachnospiraceae bacterium]|nr:glycoside hydrolase family 2 protein [Lachnospiraceae bacterium]